MYASFSFLFVIYIENVCLHNINNKYVAYMCTVVRKIVFAKFNKTLIVF